MKVAAALVKRPTKTAAGIEKGVLVLNACDALVARIPDLKDFFYLVERRGWVGKNDQRSADIKLVDDLRTLEETVREFPQAIALPFSNADFVDTNLFKPLGLPKRYTAIQISAWQKFKRHALFVKAAALLPTKRFLQFGHFWNEGGSKDKAERHLRAATIKLAESLKADITFPFADHAGDRSPADSDEVNRIINTTRMGILTSKNEGVNRFKMECLAANIPFLVAEDTSYPTKKHINEETGLFFKPTARGLADAIEYAEAHYDRFSPREYVLSHTGIRIAVSKLMGALRELARRDGRVQMFEDLRWDGRNQSLKWGEAGVTRMIGECIREVGA